MAPDRGGASVPVVYTDGSCHPNSDLFDGGWGRGGWGWWADNGRWAYGAHFHTNNNRMELLAAVDAVEHLGGPLIVCSDSTYVTGGWASDRVHNRDHVLWSRLAAAAEGRDVRFAWVRGHSGVRGNTLADLLAGQARAAHKAGTLPSECRRQGSGARTETPAPLLRRTGTSW